MNRARLTLTDVIYLLLALAALAALYPVFSTLLTAVTPNLSEGEQLIYSTVLPVSVMIILSVMYIEAQAGLR